MTGGGSGGQLAAGSGGRGTGGTGSGGTSVNGTGGSGSGGRPSETGGRGTGGSVAGTGGSGSGGTVTGTGGGAGGQGTGGAGGGSSGSGGRQVFILSIDFVGGRPPATGAGGAAGATVIASPAMAPSEMAGVKAAPQWNAARGAVGSLTDLTLSNGLVAAINVTWNSPPGASGPGVWTIGSVDAPGNVRMMNGYLDPLTPTTPATVVVANLPPEIVTPGYDVYVYVAGDPAAATTRTYRYGIGTVTQMVAQTGPPPTTFAGFTLAPAGGAGNYIVFRNVTGASFTLTATPGTGAATRAPVNGIQIVAPTGS